MVLLRSFETPRLYRGGYVSIGNFDGVHVGHRKIAERLRALAEGDDVPAVVLTFEPHPLKLLRPEHVPPSLTTLEQKAELLEGGGATCVIAYPTDRKLLQLTPEEFFDAILVAELRAKGIVEGPNFCFGKDRKGDIGALRDLCLRRGVVLDVVEPVGGETMISSSTIRSLIDEGRMAEAVELLGHPYRLRGEVVSGARRGQMIGFPTANLARIETLLPGDGVYGGIAAIGDRTFAAAINVGPNPTFGENNRKVEAHLIDFAGDLYGRSLDVDLIQRIRDTRRFESREELMRQIARDVAAARALLPVPTREQT
jgi:riboflavin kinase/FMN adenylyltransferase